MPRDFHRSRRIEEQIQRILSDLLRARVRDPRLQGAIVSAVEVSRDLSVAWVYFTSLEGDKAREDLEAAFQKASGFLRGRLATELTVRQVPELRFSYDDSMQRGSAMDQLIQDAVATDEQKRSADDDDHE